MALLDTGYRGLFEDVEPTLPIPGNIESMSPQQKAQVYNQLLSQGFTNLEIRTAIEQQIGPQSNANWGALQDIASGIRATGGTGGGALQTAFGDAASWQFGQGATYQDNMITSQDAYFQRGGDVVVSDELFWNPNSPTGDALKAKVQQAKAQGQRAGVVITPYAVFQGKASNEQLINEIKNSGVDFVALDPYLGFGVPKDDLLNWTKDFIPQLNDLGLGVKLVTQDFARAGMEQETRRYNQELMSLPGVSEFVSFGLEDAPDLQGSPDWVSLSAPTEQATQATPREPERKTAQEAPPASQQQDSPPSFSVAVAQGGLTGGQAEALQEAPQPLSAAQVVQALTGSSLPQQANVAASSLPSTVMQKASELLMGSGRANDARYADQPVGSFGEGGKVYSVYGDGSITAIQEGVDGDYFYEGFTPEGELAAQEYSDKFKQTPFDKAIGVAGNALIAAASAAALGPLGVGFSAPTAAAIGSGATTLISTGDLTQAAKAALLAGVGAYGGQEVTGLLNNAAYDLSFAAADAAQLANQGLSAGGIAQNLATYVDPATAISLANTAATQAFALADATQLTQQGLNPNQVAQVLESSGINANTAANIAQAAADGVTTLSASDIIPEVRFQRQTNLNQGLLSPADAERVMVTGQGFDIPGIQQLAQGLGTGLSTAALPTPPIGVLPTAPVDQSISVTGQNIPTSQPVGTTVAPAAAASLLTPGQSIQQQVQIEASRVDPDAASSILSSVLGQPVAVAGSTQQVQVTAETPRQISQNEAAAALSSLTGQQVQVTGQTVTNQQVADTLPAAALPQTVPVTAQTLPTTQAETMAPAATAGLLTTAPTQQVQVTSPRLDPDAASSILSSVLSQPISVAGSTQQVTVTGETPRQISPDTAAAVLSSLVGQQVQVTGQTVTSEQAAETLPAAASALLQTVPVTGQNIPVAQPETVAPAVTAGLLAPTQMVPVTAQNVPTAAANVAPAAVAALLTPPGQTVPVTAQTVPTTQQPAGPAGAMLGTAIAPAQMVPVEDRVFRTREPFVLRAIPGESVTVEGRTIPTVDVALPTGAAGAALGVTRPATPTSPFSTKDVALASLLLGGAGSLLNQPQEGGFTMDPNLANSIINAPIPTYGRGIGGYQMPGMFQIAPTNVYNPFATTAPFGTGRFGGFAAPITLPSGLL